ncbi:unnamed protein product [Victoria cruziana]
MDTVSSSAAAFCDISIPMTGLEKLPFKPEGYNYWTWRGHKVHYVEQGEGDPVVLIRGFGASAFHWRAELLKDCCCRQYFKLLWTIST